MAIHEAPSDTIRVDNFVRPSLAAHMNAVAKAPRALDSQLLVVRHAVKATISFAGNINQHAHYVEPRDRVTGIDPEREKSLAFRSGVNIATLLVLPLFQHRPEVLRHGLTYIREKVTPNLAGISGYDEIDTAQRRGEYLMNLGNFGHRYFEEGWEPLDKITDDKQLEDATNRIYLKAGAGVCMLAVWEGYRAAELEDMQKLADTTYLDQTFEAGLQQLLDN